MFDLSVFDKLDFTDSPLNITDGESFSKRIILKTNRPSTRASEIHHSLYTNTRFCNDGVHYSVRPYPVSDYALDNLLYIQSFSYQENGPRFYTFRENASSFQILYTYEGKGEFEYGGKKSLLEQGDGLFINCRQPSRYHTIGDSWKHCVLHFNGKNSDYLYDLFSKNGGSQFHQPLSGHFQEILEKIPHYMQLATPYRDIDVSNTIENLVMTLIRSNDNYRFTGADVPDSIQAVINHMYAHYTEDVCLDDLAAVSGYNKYYFCRLFKKHFHMTPQEYIIQLRILRAKELLRDTEMSIQSIGNIVGIQDTNYFYRLYKSHTGISPASYRKSVRR